MARFNDRIEPMELPRARRRRAVARGIVLAIAATK
jgi:hypothetical protein